MKVQIHIAQSGKLKPAGYAEVDTFDAAELMHLCNWECYQNEKPLNLFSEIGYCGHGICFTNPETNEKWLALSVGWYISQDTQEIERYIAENEERKVWMLRNPSAAQMQADRKCMNCAHNDAADYVRFCRFCFANGRKNWEPKMKKISEQERKATYKVALRKNGTDAQVMMAVEEMSELTKEICKMYRGKRPLDDLADEIADVLITMEQLQLIFDLGDLVDNRIAYKIQRLQKDLGMLEASSNG